MAKRNKAIEERISIIKTNDLSLIEKKDEDDKRKVNITVYDSIFIEKVYKNYILMTLSTITDNLKNIILLINKLKIDNKTDIISVIID